MGNHTVETREAAGKSKTTLCCMSIKKVREIGEKANKQVEEFGLMKAKGKTFEIVSPEEYMTIKAYSNKNMEKASVNKESSEISK